MISPPLTHLIIIIIYYMPDRHNNQPSPAIVSYKESVLTFLLKDALSGDSRTLVVTTLSPLDRHRESSVSTMAFAGDLNNPIYIL